MKKTVVFSLWLIVITFGFIGCDNGSTDNTISCPSVLRLIGENCPGTVCTCELNVPGQRVQGIAVTNRDNVEIFTSTIIPKIEETFSWFGYSFLPANEDLEIIKDKIKEIKLQSGNGSTSLNGNILTIRENVNSSDFYNSLFAIQYIIMGQSAGKDFYREARVTEVQANSIFVYIETLYNNVWNDAQKNYFSDLTKLNAICVRTGNSITLNSKNIVIGREATESTISSFFSNLLE